MKTNSIWIFLGLCLTLSDQAPDRRGTSLLCSKEEDPQICRGSFCEDTTDVERKYQLCPRFCGFCDNPADPAVSMCRDYLVNGMECRNITGICADPLGSALCPMTCLNCGSSQSSAKPRPTLPTDTACVDHISNSLTCADLPAICNDPYAKRLCRRYCKACNDSSATSPAALPTTTTTTATPQKTTEGTCVDKIGKGLNCGDLPGNICNTVMGKLLCPRHCSVCGNTTTTTAPSTGRECMDRLINGKRCDEIPKVCVSQYGPLVCRQFCNGCTGPTPQVQPAESVGTETCVDYVGHDLLCQELPGICQDSSGIGAILCPRYCQQCSPSTTPSPPKDQCTDHLINGASCDVIPGVCYDSLGTVVCKRFCGICHPATTPSGVAATTTPPSGDCQDHVGLGESCADPKYAGICQKPFASVVCPRHCGFCGTSPRPTPATTLAPIFRPCVDHVDHGLTCTQMQQAINFCSNPFSKLVCRKTCGHCHDNTTATSSTTTMATTTTSASCKPRNNPDCQDYAEEDVCNLVEFCTNPYATVVCRSTCQICDSGCEDRLPKAHGLQCSDLSLSQEDLCNDELGASVCEKTCGCTQYCP